MRLPALEQAGEQLAEMCVHRLEGVAQALAAFAIEIADRAAQTVDRLGQLFLLGGIGAVFFLDPRQLLCGDEVDRADALAAGGEAVHLLALRAGGLHRLLVELELAGEHGRRALEALAGNARHFLAPLFLVFGPGGEGGAGFAGGGKRLIGLGQPFLHAAHFGVGFVDRGFGFGKLFAEPLAHFLPAFDLCHQAFGPGSGDGALFLDFLEAGGHAGKALGGFARARLPAGDV